ncbi:MAG TPA: hypothetical protein VK809_08470 [Bacteroidia bacterium]|jgi:antitoxin component YwqK of YwqJK toxin-antitoxin module|nr:hypothetical protein [Bacteroidia bacterium]
MKLIFILLLYFTPMFCYSQQKVTDPLFWQDGKPKKKVSQNKDSNYWKIQDYDKFGKLELEYYYDSSGWELDRTYTGFYENGKEAFILNFHHDALQGPVKQFYPDGQIKFQGSCFNSFINGVWKEYYPNGEIKSVKIYALTNTDSTNTTFFHEKLKSRLTNLYFVVGTYKGKDFVDSTQLDDTDNSLVDDYYEFKTVFACCYGLKTGCWQYYDDKGTLLKNEYYNNDELVKTKKQ